MKRQAGVGCDSKCHICTGCGRCAGIDAQYHVLTHEIWQSETKAIPSSEGERLVTVDVGTTTIAMLLYHKDGNVADTYVSVNPQTEYGADVLSRIRAAENPMDRIRMKEQVNKVLCQGIAQFQKKVEPGETLRMVLVANTTMVYLLMGWNPRELGQAPFNVSHSSGVDTMIAEVPCYILPPRSAFVGGDITAGILACGMQDKEEITLLIDLGTNGELVMGNKHKMLSCSTAAGPAFEGGANRGIWGADMVSILARLCREGIVDETGLLAEPYFESGVRVGKVCVTQEAVRNLQLAKAAIAAGIRILVEEYGIAMEEIDKVILSGGFGYYLKPEDGGEIGLLPKALITKTVSGGNTALLGALRVGRWLLYGGEEGDLQEEMASLQVKNINLAEKDNFSRYYVEQMNFCPLFL